jgi:hypothetical protein
MMFEKHSAKETEDICKMAAPGAVVIGAVAAAEIVTAGGATPVIAGTAVAVAETTGVVVTASDAWLSTCITASRVGQTVASAKGVQTGWKIFTILGQLELIRHPEYIDNPADALGGVKATVAEAKALVTEAKPLIMDAKALATDTKALAGNAPNSLLPAVYDTKFAAQHVLENGKVSLQKLKSFVPQNAPSTFKPSSTIEFGQKYRFKVNGSSVEVKFHSPDAVAASKFPGSNSGTKWTAQITVDGKLLGTDGKFYSKPSNLTHIPITELP